MANNNNWRDGRKQNKKTEKVKIFKKKKKKRPLKVPQWQGWTLGMGARLHFWRDPECHFCYICGEDNHDEFFCPFNYLYGVHGLRTCNAQCPAGKHLIVSSRHREFLRCFVRVSNLPPNLGNVCRPFGPMRMWHVPMLDGKVCRGFGFAIFKSRGHAEAAIERLNGECFDGRNVRLDWAYPCI